MYCLCIQHFTSCTPKYLSCEESYTKYYRKS
nr:MAG TPA: hypothetical protein [Caudoviricetes sp.]DAP81827.1 MAG TPA: hypothetical protein [Caudoviricetes sp.]